MLKNCYRLICLLCLFVRTDSSFGNNPLRASIVSKAQREVGVKELTGHNDGIKVEAYLSSVNAHKGDPWCSAFCCFIYHELNLKNPCSAYSPSWFQSKYLVYQRGSKKLCSPGEPGDVFGLYFPEKGRIAHVGILIDRAKSYVITIEGNTNEAGSREGDGVLKKKRLSRQIYSIACWI